MCQDKEKREKRKKKKVKESVAVFSKRTVLAPAYKGKRKSNEQPSLGDFTYDTCLSVVQR